MSPPELDWDNLIRLAESEHPPDRSYAIGSAHSGLEGLLRAYGYTRISTDISFHEWCYQTAEANKIRIGSAVWKRLTLAIRARNALAHEGVIPSGEQGLAVVAAYADVYTAIVARIKPRVDAGAAASVPTFESNQEKSDDLAGGALSRPPAESAAQVSPAEAMRRLPRGAQVPRNAGAGPRARETAQSESASPISASTLSASTASASPSTASAGAASTLSASTISASTVSPRWRHLLSLFGLLCLMMAGYLAVQVYAWGAPRAPLEQLFWMILGLLAGCVGALLAVVLGWVTLVAAFVGGVGALLGGVMGGSIGALIGALLEGWAGALLGAEWGAAALGLIGACLALVRHFPAAVLLRRPSEQRQEAPL